tara:strand:+ start:4291 stop:4809 length:519 start_codon:yes stop_codon:yes gene_type:complete
MVLSKQECNEIIKWCWQYTQTNVRYFPEFDPRGLQQSRIDYNISKVTRDTNTQWFFDKIHEYLIEEYPGNKLNNGVFFYLHEFFTGSKFEKHIDKKRDCSWYLVVGATLNSEFTGGELLLYDPTDIIATNPGEVYSIPATRAHEITTVTEGTRYSFVFFISKELLGISKTIL